MAETTPSFSEDSDPSSQKIDSFSEDSDQKIDSVTSDSSSQTSDSGTIDSSSQTSDSGTSDSNSITDPTSVKDRHWVRAFPPGNHYSDLEQLSFGKWMVFRPYTQLDETWHMIRSEVECGVLSDSAVGTLSSTMFYNPTAHGPGPRKVGVICVYTTEKNIDSVGFTLINLVHHDIKFKTEQATENSNFAWKRDQASVCLRTLYWNSGKPSFLLQGYRCFGPDCVRIRDEWRLNYVTAPEPIMSKNFDCGRWVLTLKPHAELTVIWQILKGEIEGGHMGPVEMVCPPKINWKDANEEPVFLVYTARNNREYVGCTLSMFVESNEVTSCSYEVPRRVLVVKNLYDHSVVWENDEPVYVMTLTSHR